MKNKKNKTFFLPVFCNQTHDIVSSNLDSVGPVNKRRLNYCFTKYDKNIIESNNFSN